MVMVVIKSNQIKCIYIALRTSADISKCCTDADGVVRVMVWWW